MEEKSTLSFVRDLVIKIFLILLFIFLLTLIFPTPNLTPLYNRIFNDNIQTMKDAAENYFTKERMPEKEGDTSKLTLQQMLDKKLVLPFLDKNGKECDLNKSYVEVTKKKNEYELKVYLKCGNETNYIIEPIGCYNFCPDNSCVNDVKTDEDGKVTITPNKDVPEYNGAYKLQYLYTRTNTDTSWVLGDWTKKWQSDTDTVKLVDTKVEYTGKKKVDAGTTTYIHAKYGIKDNWTYDNEWTDEVKQITDTVKLADTMTLYTGQRKYTEEETKYRHVSTISTDHWTEGTWTFDKKEETDLVKLVDTRTLYTGQRKYVVEDTEYKHVRYGLKDNWTETGYQETKYKTNENVVLLGTKYTMQKTITTEKGGWSDWIEDTEWRTSKPADTATKQWSKNGYLKRTTVSKGKLINDSYMSTTPMKDTDTRIYEEYDRDDAPCMDDCCDTTLEVRYYRVYEKVTTVEYKYKYRTYSSSSSSKTDKITVYDDPKPKQKEGYSIIKYEYNYKVNNPERVVVEEKQTKSPTPPEGFEYFGKVLIKTTKYESLNGWKLSEANLGEYKYKIKTTQQYKYKYNEPTKKTVEQWTYSQTPPEGYTYANEKIIIRRTKYENLNGWVTTEGGLGEYKYNVVTKKQYKYKYNNPERYKMYEIETESIIPPEGFEYTENSKTHHSTTLVDLGSWVPSKSDLGEYTYEVQMRKSYRYKTKVTNITTESQWFDSNPGGNWVYANKTRQVAIKLYK